MWSAPNYCYRFENLASILELDEKLNEYFNIFEDSPDNKKKPDGEDARLKMRSIHQVDDYFL